eukprot:m.21083 g.21083  ORF g.21083 m.21083 type:complete len:50 (-) comp11094_c0_seq3:499-648(-)
MLSCTSKESKVYVCGTTKPYTNNPLQTQPPGILTCLIGHLHLRTHAHFG